MAYNPFDDVIEQDPAYAQDAVDPNQSITPQAVQPVQQVNPTPVRAGQTYQEIINQPSVQDEILQGSQTMADIAKGPINLVGDVFAQTLGRIAENMVNPEAAERGRMKSAIRDEAHKMFGVVPAQMTPDMIRFYEQRTGNKYEQLTFEEGINSGLNFILEDAIKGSQAIQQGARYTELPGAQQLGVGLLPFEFWLGGGGARRVGQEVGSEVIEKFKGRPLAEIVSDPQAQQEIPEVVEAIKQDYPILITQQQRVMPVDETPGFAMAQETGTGLASSTPTKKPAYDKELKYADVKKQVDNLLDNLPEGQTISAPEIAQQLNIPYGNVNFVMSKEKYRAKNNPKIVKGVSGDAPDIIKKYKRENDPQGKLTPIATYLRDMSTKFQNQFGKQPTAPELERFIKSTEQNPEIVTYFSKQNLSKMNSFKRNKSVIGVAPAKKLNIKDEIDTILKEETPTSIDLKSSLDLAEKELKATDAKDNQFTLAFKRYAEDFEPVFGTGTTGRNNFINYMKRNRDVVSRLSRLDAPGSPIPKNSVKKIERARDQLTSMLQSTKGSSNYGKYATDIDRGTPMFRFLTQKYRGMIDDKGNMLNPEKFMESYVMPYKGQTKEQTIANLTKEYNKKIDADDIAEFDEFLKVDEKFSTLKKLKEDLMDELALSGKYTDEQLEQIDLSIHPNFGHAYPIQKTLAKDRFEGLSSDPRFLRAQPAVYNVSYQSIYDNTLQKIIDELDKIKNVEELKVQKPKVLTTETTLGRVGVDIDRKDYDNQYEYLSDLFRKINQSMIDSGLISILAQNKKSKNVLDVMKNSYSDKDAAYFFGGPEKTPEEYIKMIRRKLDEMGTDLKYSKKNIKGRKAGKQAKPMVRLSEGGPVRMAMGGDPLTNLNQQQFAPDPAFEGQDYFSEAVESGNLYAFNPTKLFKLFGKVDGVQTPKKITEPEAVDAPAGTTLPATQVVQPQDFPFRSYTLEAIMDPNAPKAATPQAWADFLVKGKQSPVAELKDSGLEQYLRDFESYFPNQKITQTQLIDYYETSPIGNLSFKVKEDAPVRLNQDPAYSQYSGKQRHKEMGNQPLDEIGSEYREIVVEAGPLPGETKPYVQSGHYEEPNVIGFTRVANYTGKDGRPIAVIQELQTDMLTTVRKEQERLNAMLRRIENFRAKAQQKLQSTSEYDIMEGQRMMENLNQQYPPNVIKALEDNSNLIKPFPNEAAKELIPGFAQDIQDLQKQIDAAVKADIAQTNPETGPLLTQINQQQMEVLSKLQDLNRSGELDSILSGVKVPGTRETDELRNIAESQTFSYLDDGFGYGKKDLTLFPPIPFNKQPDYVDLLLKATIKDAQSKGINKVAIFPADLVNRRWGKTPGSDAAKKFEDLYGKVAIQQMKNIAKKYGGTAQFEAIIDSNKATKGLRYYNRNIDGNKFDILKEEVPRAELSPEEVQPFFDEQIKRIISGDPYQGYPEGDALASSLKVALTREVAPGQTMDYYVLPADNEKGFLLQPFKEGDALEDAQIVIEEFNPQEVKCLQSH